jgi:hypothetical protein
MESSPLSHSTCMLAEAQALQQRQQPSVPATTMLPLLAVAYQYISPQDSARSYCKRGDEVFPLKHPNHPNDFAQQQQKRITYLNF